ncbi:MAG: isochorismatase family protein, partial [Deltaproteobacteria bacterium]
FVPVDAAKAHVPARSQAVYFEKEVYSLFANPNAAAVLDDLARGGGVDFVVFGVATDYCVRAAAVGLVEWARARGGVLARSSVTVVRDGVCGIAADTIEAAMAEMAAAGVRLADSAEVMAR